MNQQTMNDHPSNSGKNNSSPTRIPANRAVFGDVYTDTFGHPRPPGLVRAFRVYCGLLKGVCLQSQFDDTIQAMVGLGVYPSTNTKREWRDIFEHTKAQLEQEGGTYGGE